MKGIGLFLGFVLVHLVSCSARGTQEFVETSIQFRADFAAALQPESDEQSIANWTVGQVSGVTPSAYSVQLVPGATRRGRGLEITSLGGTGYQTAWREFKLPSARDGAWVASFQVKQRLDANAQVPMVWLRVNDGPNMLAMTDSRGQSLTTSQQWESVEVTIAIPSNADLLTIGVGLVGGGTAQFDQAQLRLDAPLDSQAFAPGVEELIETALTVTKQQALYQPSIGWERLSAEVRALARQAADQEGAHAAIRHMLASLGDQHSHLIEMREGSGDARALSGELAMPHGQLLEADIGYLWLPGHLAGSEERDQLYLNSLHTIMRDYPQARAWIVDLRDNDGGRMWPMLAGLQPLLGAGTVGGFRYGLDSDSDDSWWLSETQVGYAHLIDMSWPESSLPTHLSEIPVAVLTSGRTASSGEAVAVAFRKRPFTRCFGTATRGLSTVNNSIWLQTGALMNLTVGVYVDREGEAYGGKLLPDQRVEADLEVDSQESDPTVQAAIEWIDSLFEQE